MVLDKVKKILAEYKGIDEAIIQPETSMESLGIDSLDTVELVMNLEDEFDIKEFAEYTVWQGKEDYE